MYISPRDTTQGQVSATIHFVSPHVKESKAVLDSGFHAMDSGFQVLDSGLFVTEMIDRGILDSLSYTPNSKAQDSRIHNKNLLIQDSTSNNFPDSGIWIVPYMEWGDLYDMRIF